MSSATHGRCCTGHTHDSHEIDPCMAQEIAQAEKDRILYEKLKAQSDKLLMNLNIRSCKGRVRGAVAQVEDDEECSSSEECPLGSGCSSDVEVVQILPSQFTAFQVKNKASKIFLFCVPCDMSPDFTRDHVDTLFRALRKSGENPKPRFVGVIARFSTKLCVCGRCLEVDSRPTGTLRSVAMILNKAPSVVVTRNGGLVGVWSAPPTEAEASLHSFISKHV